MDTTSDTKDATSVRQNHDPHLVAGELLEQKNKLEQINSWFDIALNNMALGLSMFDADQRLIVCNAAYRRMYDLPDELIRPGTPLAEIVRYFVKRETGRDLPEDLQKQQAWIAGHVAKLAGGCSYSHLQKMKDGRKLLVTYQPLSDGGWVDIQEDVTERRRAQERVEWLARHDALTGLANRFHFREKIEAALTEVHNDKPIALHWLDLDNFKQINDTFGHPVGDALLKSVAHRLRTSVRRVDFLARLGGDEFAIVQSGATSEAQCEFLARRVLERVSQPHHVHGHTLVISASIGIARAPVDGTCADELLKNADVELYDVKQAGRRGFAIYRNRSDSKADVQRRIEQEIRVALSQDQLQLYYQPVVNLVSHHVSSCEALLRWHHPRLGMLGPNEFLRAAEKTGVMPEIGRWALKQACRDAMAWAKNVKVTVNLSPLQFTAGDLPANVQSALSDARLDPARLRLEIGEGLLDKKGCVAPAALDELRGLGIGITLDDFGKASGSLSNLQAYPFDEIKIDRTLVKDLPLRADSRAIFSAVAGLARSLGIRSVAEGVETRDELTMVARFGCNKVQGFYISRPVPAAELTAVLSECPSKLAVAA
jgi:diguanylate cyclase (GGDEF)-like protein